MPIDAATWGQCRQALDNLMKYAERDKFADLRDAVGAAHFAGAYAVVGDDGGLDELVELVDEDVVASILGDATLDFAVRPDPRGRTLVDRYLDERGARETPVGRDFLRALKASSVGVYEVLSDGAGGAFELRDALGDGATLQVAADPDLDPLEPGELIGARVSHFRGAFCFAGGVWTIRSEGLEALRSALAGDGVEEIVDDPDFGGVSAEELRAGVRENLAAMISNLVIQQELGDAAFDDDEDDEPYEPTRVSWDVADESAAAMRLDAHPECARWPEEAAGGEAIWSWLDLDTGAGLDEEDPEAGEDDDLLGTIRLGGGKLELFVNSELRAENGQLLLEEALAGLLRNGRAEPFSLDQALAGGNGAATS